MQEGETIKLHAGTTLGYVTKFVDQQQDYNKRYGSYE